jgi:4-oxalmesaconate hydratase
MQFIQHQHPFDRFPGLKFVIPHGGGAVPYHWGRYRGIGLDAKKGEIAERLLQNVSFDTCVYHQIGINLLTEVIPSDNIIFASEMIGAVRGIDPRTNRYFDDTKPYIDASPHLKDADREKIFEKNARRVYPRLSQYLK